MAVYSLFGFSLDFLFLRFHLELIYKKVLAVHYPDQALVSIETNRPNHHVAGLSTLKYCFFFFVLNQNNGNIFQHVLKNKSKVSIFTLIAIVLTRYASD